MLSSFLKEHISHPDLVKFPRSLPFPGVPGPRNRVYPSVSSGQEELGPLKRSDSYGSSLLRRAFAEASAFHPVARRGPDGQAARRRGECGGLQGRGPVIPQEALASACVSGECVERPNRKLQLPQVSQVWGDVREEAAESTGAGSHLGSEEMVGQRGFSTAGQHAPPLPGLFGGFVPLLPSPRKAPSPTAATTLRSPAELQGEATCRAKAWANSPR